MSAKEIVLEHAPSWSEAQAKRALAAAEGDQAALREAEAGGYEDLLKRAAALRARQPHFVDAAALVREGREELERRAS
jgi:hypothetical protein